METMTPEQHQRWLDGFTTQHLVESYAAWPTIEVQRALERRGVILWHYGLQPVAR